MTGAQSASTPDGLLVVESAEKHFGGVAAVSDFSMSVPAGSVAGLMGPNGAGKTTLVNLISGLLHADAGVIRFAGHDIQRLPAHEIAALGIARRVDVSFEVGGWLSVACAGPGERPCQVTAR